MSFFNHKDERNKLQMYHDGKCFTDFIENYQKRQNKFIYLSIILCAVISFFVFFFSAYNSYKTERYREEESKPDLEIHFFESGKNGYALINCEDEFLWLNMADGGDDVKIWYNVNRLLPQTVDYVFLDAYSASDLDFFFNFQELSADKLLLPWTVETETPTDCSFLDFVETTSLNAENIRLNSTYSLGVATFEFIPSDDQEYSYNTKLTFCGNEFLIGNNKVEILNGEVKEKYRTLSPDDNGDFILKSKGGDISVEFKK